MTARGIWAGGLPPPASIDMGRDWPALAICAVLSIALHAALLAFESAPQQRPMGIANSASASSLQARLVHTSTAPAEPPVPDTPSITPPRAPVNQAKVPSSSPPRPAAIENRSAAVPVPELPQSAPAVSPRGGERGDYVPRPQLSVGPVPVSAIVLETPPGQVIATRQTGILSLFIDEEGRVQHIEAGEPTLAPALEEAARAAFMGARFLPGQIGGRPVKSRLRVEASFEATLSGSDRAARPIQ